MENSTKNSKRKQFLSKTFQLFLFVGLGIFFVWLSFRGLGADDKLKMRESIAQIKNPMSWIFLTLSFSVTVLSHYFRALRSVILIEPLQYKIRKSMSFYSVMVCYFANLAFPRLGEVLRCTFLQRYEKVPFQKSLGTIVTERAIDILIWLILLVIAILINTSVLSELVINKEEGINLGMWLENKGNAILTNYMLYAVIGIVVVLGIIIYLTRHQWGKIPFFVKMKDFSHGIWQGLISVKNVKHPVKFVIYTIMIWICFFFGTYFCFFAFDFLHGLGPLAAFSVLIFGSIGFMIAQGGLGAYPLVVAGVLVLYHVDYSAALAAGWIGWGVQTMIVIIVGLASLVLASFTDRKDNKTALTQNHHAK
jgi:uncharacterized membrane protein YbhN (UPF0104 family)